MDGDPISIDQIEEPEPSPNEIEKTWGPGRQIDEDTENRIAQLRLAGMGVRDVAKTCNVSTGTVTNAFRRWLRTHAEESLGDPRQLAMEVVTRLWQNANNARRDYMQADDTEGRARMLNAERQAIMDIAKLVGIDVTRIQVDHVGVTGDELDNKIEQVLAELGLGAVIDVEATEVSD